MQASAGAADAARLARLQALGSATIFEAQGARGALDHGIKPIDPGMKLVGRAYTVDSWPADNLMLHYALTRARAGDVLVVDAKGFMESGIWGDVMTCAAQTIGLAGLVVDGAVRDAEAMVEAGFPVFARGLSIKGSGKRQVGRAECPVTVGGVVVRPGDIVVGDRDGLVVVEAEELVESLRLAEAREAKEAEVKARIRAGETTWEMMGLAAALGPR